MANIDDVDLLLDGKPADLQEEIPGTVSVLATQSYDSLVRNQQVPLFDWANMIWETEEEPPAFFDKHGKPCKGPLLHLYTVTGFLSIGYWPEGEPIGRHFVSWAYVNPNFDSHTQAVYH